MRPSAPTRLDDDLPARWLAQVIRRENVAFLCGAGASVPSGLPPAQQFVEHLIEALVRTCAPVPELPDELLGRLCARRLEDVLQVLEQTPAASTTGCLQALDGMQPNLIHLAVMGCLASYGRRPGIALTTNFEHLLEDAAERLSDQDPTVLVAPGLGAPGTAKTIVVKLHGDLRTALAGGDGRQLSDTLDRFSRRFASEDEQRLGAVLDGKTLVVLGYSGSDHYDVMPLLSRHPFERLVWFQHDSAVKAGTLRRAAPPPFLTFFLSRPDDLYVRGDTAAVLRAVTEELGLTLPPVDGHTNAARWRRELHRYVGQLGLHANLVLGDLVMSEQRFQLAIDLYRSAFDGLSNSGDAPGVLKAARAMGSAFTLLGRPDEALAVLAPMLETVRQREPRDPAAEASILNEVGLAYKTAAVTRPAYAKSALFYLMEAANLAESAGSEQLAAVAQRNLGVTFYQLALNGDVEFDNGIDAAAAAFESAMHYYKKHNLYWRIKQNAFDLATCCIARDRCDDAVDLFQQLAGYERAVAYLDEGRTLRLLLGYVAASAGLSLLMGDSPMNQLLDVSLLMSIGVDPATMVKLMQSALRAFDSYLAGPPGQVVTGWDVVRLVEAQAHAIAENELGDWSYQPG